MLINNFLWFLHSMKELLWAILFMSEPTFGVWLWPQLSWCSMCMSRYYFVSKIYHKYQSSLFNLLFELPNGMYLIASYLLPSFSLVTLEKIVLIKKVYSKINYKSNLFKAWFSMWNKKLLIVIKLHILAFSL